MACLPQDSQKTEQGSGNGFHWQWRNKPLIPLNWKKLKRASDLSQSSSQKSKGEAWTDSVREEMSRQQGFNSSFKAAIPYSDTQLHNTPWAPPRVREGKKKITKMMGQLQQHRSSEVPENRARNQCSHGSEQWHWLRVPWMRASPGSSPCPAAVQEPLSVAVAVTGTFPPRHKPSLWASGWHLTWGRSIHHKKGVCQKHKGFTFQWWVSADYSLDFF